MGKVHFNSTNTPPVSDNSGQVKGYSFLVVCLVVMALLTGAAINLARFQQSVLASSSSNITALQAYEYAESKADIIKLTKYDELTAQAKKDLAESNYQDEVLVSEETDNDSYKEREVTVNVYVKGEIRPRATLKLIRSTAANDSAGCEVRTGTNSVSFQAVGSYKYLTVIVSSKFSPSDSSWSGSATFTASAAGVNLGTVSTSTYTQKAGSKGHYWGTTENVVNMHTFARAINAGDTVSASLTSSSRHSGSTVTVILSN